MRLSFEGFAILHSRGLCRVCEVFPDGEGGVRVRFDVVAGARRGRTEVEVEGHVEAVLESPGVGVSAVVVLEC